MAIENPFLTAACEADIVELRRLVSLGADVNACDANGEPFLFDVLLNLSEPHAPSIAHRRFEVIATLLELGANPHTLDADGGSILIGPIFGQDASMLEFLLAQGVDPNRGCGEPWETVYDAAVADYYYQAWCQPGFPKLGTPTPEEVADADSILPFLDREARAAGQLRPEMLFILRRHGAKANHEIVRQLGGNGSERIIWRDGQWQLDLSRLGDRL